MTNQTPDDAILAELLKQLRRCPDSRPARLCLAMVKEGVMPPADMLRRAGVRTGGGIVA